MRVLLELLVAGSIGLTVWFLVDLGRPWRSEGPLIAWLLALWGGVTVAFETLLLLALLSVEVPAWIAALVLAAQDGVFAWRLILLRRARLADRRAVKAEGGGSDVG